MYRQIWKLVLPSQGTKEYEELEKRQQLIDYLNETKDINLDGIHIPCILGDNKYNLTSTIDNKYYEIDFENNELYITNTVKLSIYNLTVRLNILEISYPDMINELKLAREKVLSEEIKTEDELNNYVYSHGKFRIQYLTRQLQFFLDTYTKYTIPFYYNKLTKEQQVILIEFLNLVEKELKNVTEDTKIPEVPEFLKEL